MKSLSEQEIENVSGGDGYTAVGGIAVGVVVGLLVIGTGGGALVGAAVGGAIFGYFG